MLSDIFILEEHPESYYFKTRHLREFLLKSLRIYSEKFWTSKISFSIYDDRNKEVRNTAVNKKDKLVFLVDGKIVSEIKLSKILD